MWPGYHLFFRKQCCHLVAKWVNFWVWWIKYHWCETGLKPVVSKDFTFKKGLVLYPAKKEEVHACHIVLNQKKFNVMLPYITFKKKTSTCGSHLDCSVARMGQQVWPTFNPESWNMQYIAIYSYYLVLLSQTSFLFSPPTCKRKKEVWLHYHYGFIINASS